MISHENKFISQAAVQLIGCYFYNDDIIADVLLHDNALDSITNILYKEENYRVKEALWAFSNLAGSKPHYEIFIKSDAFRRCLTLANSHDIDVQAEAIWTLANAISMASQSQCP